MLSYFVPCVILVILKIAGTSSTPPPRLNDANIISMARTSAANAKRMTSIRTIAIKWELASDKDGEEDTVLTVVDNSR